MVNKIMKGKKGWIEIVEAFVAILLIAGVVLVILNKSSLGGTDISQQVYTTELSILREVQTNDIFRAEIITQCVTGKICSSGTCVAQGNNCPSTKTDAQVCGNNLCGIKNDNCQVQRVCGSCSGTTPKCAQVWFSMYNQCFVTSCSDLRTDSVICGTAKCGFAVDNCGNPRTCGLPLIWASTSFPTDIKNKIIARTPNYLICQGKICSINDKVCSLDSPPSGKDIYSQSVIITSTLQSIGYKQLKLFCWTK
jgi:hypothetical protein